jgi:hypothetical protein
MAKIMYILATASPPKKHRGDLTIPCQSPCSTSTGPLSSTCAALAVADLPTRWAQAQYPSTWTASSTSRLKWGPDLNTYAAVTAAQVWVVMLAPQRLT